MSRRTKNKERKNQKGQGKPTDQKPNQKSNDPFRLNVELQRVQHDLAQFKEMVAQEISQSRAIDLSLSNALGQVDTNVLALTKVAKQLMFRTEIMGAKMGLIEQRLFKAEVQAGIRQAPPEKPAFVWACTACCKARLGETFEEKTPGMVTTTTCPACEKELDQADAHYVSRQALLGPDEPEGIDLFTDDEMAEIQRRTDEGYSRLVRQAFAEVLSEKEAERLEKERQKQAMEAQRRELERQQQEAATQAQKDATEAKTAETVLRAAEDKSLGIQGPSFTGGQGSSIPDGATVFGG